MPRPQIRHSTVAQCAAFRDVFGMTERQTQFVAALIAAHNLGVDGVTAKDLELLLPAETAHRAAELQRMRLVECVGLDETRAKKWRATATAYRRFELPVPELPAVETAADRANSSLDRLEERRRVKAVEKYRRERESA